MAVAAIDSDWLYGHVCGHVVPCIIFAAGLSENKTEKKA
jgi:hypothetical protein